MGDYKSCARNPVIGVPNIAVRIKVGEFKIVGEMKVSWIPEHDLLLKKAYKRSSWKRLLG